MPGWLGRLCQLGRHGSPAGLEELRPSSPRRRLACVGVVFGVTVLVCGFLDMRGFSYLEQYFYNLRLSAYATRNGSLAERARQDIVLITESDYTFGSLPGPPVPRSYHAKVIRDLKRAGAKVIAFDLFFDVSRREDRELAAAAKAAGNVVWASYFISEGTPEQEYKPPNAELRVPGTTTGHTMVAPASLDHPETDRLAPVIMDRGQAVPAFCVQVVARALGLQSARLQPMRDGWRVGFLRMRTDQDGSLGVRFLGNAGEVFPLVPYEQVAAGAVDDPFYRDNRIFAGKIAVIGDQTTIGNDHRATSAGDMWGAEFHAHAIATLLQRGFIREVPAWGNLCVLAGLTALVCLLGSVWRLRWTALASILLVAGYFVANVWLFTDHDTWVHLVAPSAGMAMGLSGMLLQRGLIEEAEKSRIRGMLRRYLSPQTAEYVLANPEACVLGGRRVEATVLFSDVRGFTALSEALTPETVVTCLNEYLEAMTEVVFRHEGTVDKYVGDCIMVLFGVPVPCADHAARAVATAIDMQAALLSLQSQWRQRGAPVLDAGIGVHTGEMVVGNIGSRQRLDYTVIGDAVNLAARVEGLNKVLGTRILITQDTYDRVRGEVEARGPFTTSVAGREQDAVVYEVVGWRRASG
jgi:adenylate cyclase